MDVKTIVNSVGLLLNIVGVAMVYWFSPLNEYAISGGDAFTDSDKIERETKRRNELLKLSVGVVIFGSILQLV